MPTISWRPPRRVVYLLLSTLCSRLVAASTSNMESSSVSLPRDKKGRISQYPRGGSLSTRSPPSATKKRIRQRRNTEDQELDTYIDFLISVYPPQEEEVNETHHTTNNSNNCSKDDITTQCSGVKALHPDQRRGLPALNQEEAKITEHEKDASFHRMDMPAAETDIDDLELSDICTENPNSAPLMEQTGGGGDDDDNDDEEEAQLLDQYIEFLQEDYENDRALDRYIEFVQEDYETDRTLDAYIGYLLATTTASVPSTSSSNVSSTTATAAEAAPVANPQEAMMESAAEDVVIVDITTEEQQQPQPTLDDYIDSLVSAVELDEYIDQLVASRSAIDEEPTAAEEDEEEIPSEEMDSYIETLVSSATTAEDNRAVELDTKLSAQKMEEESGIANDEEKVIVAEVSVVPAKPEAKEMKVKKQQPQSKVEKVKAAPRVVTLPSEHDSAIEKPITKKATKKKKKPQSKLKASASVSSRAAGTTSSVTKAKSIKKTRKKKTKLAVDTNEQVGKADKKIAVGVGGDDDGDGEGDDDNQRPTTAEVDSIETTKPKKKKRKKKEKTVTFVEDKEVVDIETKGEQSEQEEDEASVALKEPVSGKVETKATIEEEEETQDVEPVQTTPNGLYRFLLRQGFIGHILVLALVLLVEWVQLYVPQLADLLAVVWSKAAPTGLQRRMAPQKLTRRGEGSSSSTLQHLYTGRMPAKGRERRKLSKKADEEALNLLKTVGDIQDAKYKHVSVSFLQRHRLGPYRGEESEEDDGDDEPVAFLPSSRKQAKRPRKKPVLQGDDDDEASDVDWVLESLSNDNTAERKKKKSSPIDTTLSLGSGPKGPTAQVGVEFSLGGTEASGSGGKRKPIKKRRPSLNTEIISRDSVRKKNSVPRQSDRDGGSGVLGRLRAAATSNSLMKKSLLGAYPGDAADLDESASARGVAALAAKYGYGEWSEDDEDIDGGFGDSANKRRRKKNKRRRHSNDPAGDTFDLASLVSDSESDATPFLATPQTRRKKKSPSGRSSISTSLRDDAKTKRRKRKDKPREDSAGLSGIDELSKKAETKNPVRPALQRLKETKANARKSSDTPDEG